MILLKQTTGRSYLIEELRSAGKAATCEEANRWRKRLCGGGNGSLEALRKVEKRVWKLS
jgi:hypothetical protein